MVARKSLMRLWLGLALAGLLTAGAHAYVPDEGALSDEEAGTSDDSVSPYERPAGTPFDLPFGPGESGLESMDPGNHFNEPDATSVPAARASLADVSYGTDDLPEPVAKARAALIEAARTGDIEALRPIFEAQTVPPIVADFDTVDDPVDHLKLQSGDEEGREILAILLEILETGHVKVGAGSTTTYVWPYFAEVPLDSLGPRHQVELYRILTAIDVEEMARFGRYTFFRVGIAPDGRIRYFSAGELE